MSRPIFCPGQSQLMTFLANLEVTRSQSEKKNYGQLLISASATVGALLIVATNQIVNLTGINGLSEAKVDKICEAVEKTVRKAVVRITTGSQALDELLGGDEAISVRSDCLVVPVLEKLC